MLVPCVIPGLHSASYIYLDPTQQLNDWVGMTIPVFLYSYRLFLLSAFYTPCKCVKSTYIIVSVQHKKCKCETLYVPIMQCKIIELKFYKATM
jgi:hypothetical protein